MILQTLRSLHEQGTIRLGPDHAVDDIAGKVRIEEATEIDFTQQAGVAPRGGSAGNSSGAEERTPLHLAPLFDEWGIARLAAGDLVHKLGSSRRIQFSSFAEHNREAAEA
eukprot:3349828-Pyramimonas_sp.AAC.1